MSRLQRKCLLVSVATHGLMLLLVVAGPMGFVSKEEKIDLPILDFIPDKAVEEALFAGAAASSAAEPKVRPPSEERVSSDVKKVNAEELREVKEVPPERPVEPRVPAVPKSERRKPAVAKEDPALTKKSPSVKPPEQSRPAREARTNEVASGKPRIKVDLSKKTVVKADAATAKSEEETGRARGEQFAKALNRFGSTLAAGTASSTSISLPGPGREAYANYAQIVKSRYFQAWSPPDDLADEQAAVEAKIVIARDGAVVSAVITRKSGHAGLDKTVERALRLDFIAPFPEGAKDAERTFLLKFNLQAKRASG